MKVAGLSKDEIFKIGQKLRTLSLFLVITSMMGLIVMSLSSFITKIVDSLKSDVVKNENYVNMSSERLEEKKVNEQSLYNQRYNMINGRSITENYNPVVGVLLISSFAGCKANLERLKEEIIPPVIKLKSAKAPLHFAEQIIKKFPQEEKSEGKPNVDNNKSTAQSERREENSKLGSKGNIPGYKDFGRESGEIYRERNPSPQKGYASSDGQGGMFQSVLDSVLNDISSNVGVSTKFDNVHNGSRVEGFIR